MRKETTKVCKCGNTYLGLLPSLNKKYCPACHSYIDWYLEQGQKSPLTSHIGGLADIPSQVKTDKPIPEYTMLPNKTFIPLFQAPAQDIADFVYLLGQAHECEIPDEFIETAVQESISNPKAGIFIFEVNGDLILTVGVLRNDVTDVKQISINAAVVPLALSVITQLADKTQEAANSSQFDAKPEEPVVEDKTEVHVKEAVIEDKTNAVIKEAVDEYREVLKEFVKLVRDLNFPSVSASRVDNIKYILAELVKGYKNSLVFH